MAISVTDNLNAYMRELSAHRLFYFCCFLFISVSSIIIALLWPKSYTSSATIWADNSNILTPLMAGNAVSTSIEDQAQMAQEILFNREFNDEILEAGGWEYDNLTPADEESLIRTIQEKTVIASVRRNPANLIRISHTDRDPIRAFSVAQKYTSIFIEESVVKKRNESKSAFDFIQNQVTSYHSKLQESEERLSKFKSENNLGTLADANSRFSRYKGEIERLELDLAQLNSQEQAVQAQLSGQEAVSRDLSDLNSLRSRINALQIQLDSLRSRYYDNYPDVVQLKEQIDDLMEMYDSGQSTLLPFQTDALDNEGVTPLHQELRSQLAAIQTAIVSRTVQLNGLNALLDAEADRIKQINSAEAQLAELTRDYNVTRDFYNDMLKRLENARVSMNMDEQQQGVTFKVQESAVIPTQPDGFSLRQLLAASLILALVVPIGLLVLYMELDPRIHSESHWSTEWPPLLMAIPPSTHAPVVNRRMSNKWFVFLASIIVIGLYGSVVGLKLAGII